jgi:hypothetical protein
MYQPKTVLSLSLTQFLIRLIEIRLGIQINIYSHLVRNSVLAGLRGNRTHQTWHAGLKQF